MHREVVSEQNASFGFNWGQQRLSYGRETENNDFMHVHDEMHTRHEYLFLFLEFFLCSRPISALQEGRGGGCFVGAELLASV